MTLETLEKLDQLKVRANNLNDVSQLINTVLGACDAVLDEYSDWTYKIEAINYLALAQGNKFDFKFFTQVMEQLSKELRHDMWKSEKIAGLIETCDRLREIKQELSGVPKGS